MQFKKADDREPDLLALERLLDRPAVPSSTRGRIEAEIRNIRAGAKAEKDAAYELEFWFGRAQNWATIHDLRIEVDGLTAQMDHLVLNRLGQIWVCESKSFAEGVSVNELGEWSRWWRRGREGMSSPIEQNRRHIALLGRAFDSGLVAAPRRLGFVPVKPEIRSLILVSSNARIDRPKRRVDGIETVVKADQLKTRLLDEFDRVPEWRVATVIGKEGLAALAKSLVALHRPASVDWPARFGLNTAVPSVPDHGPVRLTAAPWKVKYDGPCALCGRVLAKGTAAVWDQRKRRMSCLDCASGRA